MDNRLDEVDQRIIHALMDDARNTSAPMIAADLDVSAGTVRNRIERLEDGGVIQGYHAMVNFERAGGRLVSLYMCTVPADERERLAVAARSIPGVVNVRVLMAGRRDIHVVAVGNDTEDLREIARSLSELEIRIEDEELLQTEIRSPYDPFAPTDAGRTGVRQVITLADGAEIVELAVPEGAPITGVTLDAARTQGLLAADAEVVSVERDEGTVDPDEETVLETDDIVALHVDGIDLPPVGFRPEADAEAGSD